jgi:hypothetical protein
MIDHDIETYKEPRVPAPTTTPLKGNPVMFRVVVFVPVITDHTATERIIAELRYNRLANEVYTYIELSRLIGGWVRREDMDAACREIVGLSVAWPDCQFEIEFPFARHAARNL